MIIIVVIDKLLAFTGPFPITLSEKLFASGAPRLLSADPEAASCSWRGVWVISEKTFFSLFFFLYILLLTLLLMTRPYRSHPRPSPPTRGQSQGSFRCICAWGRDNYPPATFSWEHFFLPRTSKILMLMLIMLIKPSSIRFSLGEDRHLVP